MDTQCHGLKNEAYHLLVFVSRWDNEKYASYMALYRSFVPKVCRQPLLVSTYPANLVVNFEVAGYSAVKLKAKRFHSIWERAKWSILFCRKWEKKTSIANIITCYRENEQYYEGVSLDHCHKWRPLLHFFVFMLIRPTALILEQKLF